MRKTLLTAAWIAPMSGPLMRDAGVVFCEGRVTALGPIGTVKSLHPDAEIHDAGNAVILPGLVNAHTHLELSWIKRGGAPASFVDWIIDLMSRAPAGNVPDAVWMGMQQCLQFGVTTVGDITSQPGITRKEIAATSLSGVSFGEVRAMAQRRGFLETRINAAIESAHAAGESEQDADKSARLQLGISPHAPYSIEIDGYRRCLETAKRLRLPLATHLAETPDESTFLADHTGPFKRLWDLLNAWDEKVPRFSGGPIRFAEAIGLLDYPTLLAHVNYCDDAEMDLLARGQASVVHCPRTHQFFGHLPHRWREMLARGINVAVGTDSCASSPDLNLVDDLRLLHEIAPEVDPFRLCEIGTIRGAAALGIKGAGHLSVGALANAVVFPVMGDDPLREVLEASILPSAVWIAGRWISLPLAPGFAGVDPGKAGG